MDQNSENFESSLNSCTLAYEKTSFELSANLYFIKNISIDCKSEKIYTYCHNSYQTPKAKSFVLDFLLLAIGLLALFGFFQNLI